MEYSLREMVFMGLSVIAAALLVTLCLPLARMAGAANREYTLAKMDTAALAAEREWHKHTGIVTGAVMIGFIARHKDSCDIVVRNRTWNARLLPYLSDGALVLGLADMKQMPDYIWDTAFLFDALLDTQGERLYQATLLYNDKTIIGIYYEEL